MSKIPRFDRNKSTGALNTPQFLSENSPNSLRSKIPLPISPKKEISRPVYTDPTLNSSKVLNEQIKVTLPLNSTQVTLQEHFDIREVSTPSHFDDISADIQSSHSLPEEPITLDDHDISSCPDAEGEEEQVVSSRTPKSITPPATSPIPIPDNPETESTVVESHPREDCHQIQELACESTQSELLPTDSPPVPSQSSPLSAHLANHRHSPDGILSPQIGHGPSFQLPPTLPPDCTLVPYPSQSSSHTPDVVLSPTDNAPLSHSSPEHDSTLDLTALSDTSSPRNRFIPIPNYPISHSLYDYPPISQTNHWTLDSPVIPPMLPPLPSPTFDISYQDIRPYYHLRTSTDSPDLTSMSYGTPMDTPSPVPSLLSTPDLMLEGNLSAFPDSDGMSQQLNALRDALDDSTRERARLVNIVREQEIRSQQSNASLFAGELPSETERLREECARLQAENAKLQNTHTRMEDSETRSALLEAMRARDMLAEEFEHLKAYQLQLEEELRVEREKIMVSPLSPLGKPDLPDGVPNFELESVKLENSGLREKVGQLMGEHDMRIKAEEEILRMTVELEEVEKSASLKLRENESYFLSQLRQEQDTTNMLRQANKQLAQDLNEQHSSARLIHSEMKSLSEHKEGLEEDLISRNKMCSELQQQLTERDGRLLELEEKQGHLDLDVLDTLKRELERVKLEKEGVEMKLTQEMQQTLQYMEAKKRADNEVARLGRELLDVKKAVENEQLHELRETLQTEQMTSVQLGQELERERASFEKLRENLTVSLTEKRNLEREYSLLEHSCAQTNATFEQKVQECLNLERIINNMQVEASVAEDQVKSLEDSKQALSSLISLLSQIISEFSAAVKLSQGDHQYFTQEMKSLFDEVSCPVGTEENTPQAFENLKLMVQRQGLQLEQLMEKESRLHAYTEEVRMLRAKLEKLERDKLVCEEKILELVANNASLQTRVNFNTSHMNGSFSLSQILPPDVFSNVTQNCSPSEPILQSQLELTGQASPLPDPPNDYFSGELRETRRELKSSQDLTIRLKQDLAKSHGCILSLQTANEEVTETSRSAKRRAETAEAEIEKMRNEAEENAHSSADKVARISRLEGILETVLNKVTQGIMSYHGELARIGNSQSQHSTNLSAVQTAQSDIQEFLSEELSNHTTSISLSDQSQLPLLLDKLFRSRQVVLAMFLKRHDHVIALSRQLHTSMTENSDTREELEENKGQKAELTRLKESVERALEDEKSAVSRLRDELTVEQERRQLKEDEVQDMERIVTSVKHELEQERFLHQQQSSERESGLRTEVEQLREANQQLKRDCDLLSNRMQHFQITSTNQVEQLNAQLCQTQTEVTRLQGANSKLSERMKHDTASLNQLSSSHAAEIETLTQELTQNKTEMVRYHNEIQSQQKKLSEKDQVLAELVTDLEELRAKKQNLIAQYESVQENKISEMNRKLEILENENRSLSEENSRLKITFETELPSILDSNKQERTQLQGAIRGLSDKNAQLTQNLSEYKSALSRSEQEMSKLKQLSQEQMQNTLCGKRELEEELGKLKQEYTAEITSLQREIPLELINGAEDQDLICHDSESPSLPAVIRKICHENSQLKMRCRDLEISILEGRAESLPGTSTPDFQDHSDLVCFKKSSFAFSDAKPTDKILRTKKKQLELLRLKLGYTLRELRMYKVLKSAYDQQIDDLKKLLSESGDKYVGCIQKISELEQLCFRDD